MTQKKKEDDPCDDWSKHPMPKQEDDKLESEQ
jgi:hypothetical protein